MAVTLSGEPAAMRPLLRRCTAFAPLLLLVFLVSDQNISARTRMPFDMPALVLWAWDRDDDLSFIDSRDTAVISPPPSSCAGSPSSLRRAIIRWLLPKAFLNSTEFYRTARSTCMRR